VVEILNAESMKIATLVLIGTSARYEWFQRNQAVAVSESLFKIATWGDARFNAPEAMSSQLPLLGEFTD